jgi:5-methylcytosine-specific restriction endonuclease McrA
MFPKPNSKAERAKKKRTNIQSHSDWIDEIILLDNVICQSCGENFNLEVPHHILFKSQFIEFIYAVWNGILFCVKCHYKAHHGYKGLTARQWMMGILEKLPENHRCKRALTILKKKEPDDER